MFWILMVKPETSSIRESSLTSMTMGRWTHCQKVVLSQFLLLNNLKSKTTARWVISWVRSLIRLLLIRPFTKESLWTRCNKKLKRPRPRWPNSTPKCLPLPTQMSLRLIISKFRPWLPNWLPSYRATFLLSRNVSITLWRKSSRLRSERSVSTQPLRTLRPNSRMSSRVISHKMTPTLMIPNRWSRNFLLSLETKRKSKLFYDLRILTLSKRLSPKISS